MMIKFADFTAKIVLKRATFLNIRSMASNIGKINHVAIATNNLDKQVNFYKNILGAKVSNIVSQKEHGVSTVFVELGETQIELLSEFGDKSPIKKFLEGNSSGGGIHHICIEVENINETIKKMKENKIRLLSEEPKDGAHGKLVIFAHPKDCGGVLIEFEQK